MLKHLCPLLVLLGTTNAQAFPDQGPIGLRSSVSPPPNKAILPVGAAATTADFCEGLGEVPRRTDALPFRPGEELAYELRFAGAYIGRFETKVGQPRTKDGQTYLTLFGRARTSAFFSAFSTFEGRYQSLARADHHLAPEFARVEATFGDDHRWERINFGEGNRSLRDDYLFKGAQRARSYDSNHALTDLLTMLYQARTIAVRPGLTACQDVFGNRWLWRMRAEVVGTERVDTPRGPMNAWKVKTHFERAPHPEAPAKPQTIDLELYLAQDGSQAPLKLVAHTLGITAEANLVRWSLNAPTDSGY